MVGCRNGPTVMPGTSSESIKHSDGGVSEPPGVTAGKSARVYQAFRWWGVGTVDGLTIDTVVSLSSIPMVGLFKMKA